MFHFGLKDGDQAVTVIGCPVEVKTKEDLRKCLEWWNVLIGTMRSSWISDIISPSAKYDPVVMLISKLTGIDSLLVDPSVAAAPPYIDLEDIIERVKNEGQRIYLRAEGA